MTERLQFFTVQQLLQNAGKKQFFFTFWPLRPLALRATFWPLRHLLAIAPSTKRL